MTRYLLFLVCIGFALPLFGRPTPSFSEVKGAILSSESILYDRKGNILQEIRTNPNERRLEWIGLGEISPFFLDALLLAEDKRFYEHSGVDYLALGSGFFRLFSTKPLRGASTITMQLVGILKEELRGKRRRTIYQKWLQILDAKELEGEWSKEDILEAYVNLVSFRGELVGIGSASRGLLRKSPHGLTLLEGILLASLIKHPSAPLEKIRERACFLSAQAGIESCDPILALADSVFSKPYFIQHTYTLAPHLARRLQPKMGGIISTLDRDLQIFSIEALHKQITRLRGQNVRDGAVLVRDNSNGEILAYVGGTEYSLSPGIDAIRAKRQAGSTLKPFLYGLALEKRRITPTSLLSDSPFEIQIDRTGVYSPSNYQSNFHGMVTARVALGSSLNIPAIRLLEQVGISEFHTFLESLGFSLPEDPEYYGLSLALGSPEISLWEAVASYSSLAAGGIYFESGLIPGAEHPETSRVLSAPAAFLVSQILSDRDARVLSFGLDSPLSTRFSASVKTGTSKDMKDNWCIGYTNQYTVGVWVGNFSGEPMWNVSGVSGAAPVWQEVMEYLHRSPNLWLTEPEGVRKIALHYRDGTFAAEEYFIAGTEPPFYPEAGNLQKNGILYPLSGEIIALDPDIPDSRQVIFFEPKKFTPNLSWRINGETIEPEREIFFWKPQRGRHQLELKENGNLIEKIFFEVR